MSNDPSPHESVTATYIISVAAELAGMHPQTLRIYEQRGLVAPARTVGGSRRYSDVDIANLRYIQELTNQGINLEGVKRILELEARVQSASDEMDRAREEMLEIVRNTERSFRRDLVPFTPRTVAVFRPGQP